MPLLHQNFNNPKSTYRNFDFFAKYEVTIAKFKLHNENYFNVADSKWNHKLF